MENGSSVSLDERIEQLIKMNYTPEKAEAKARDERALKAAQESALSPPGALKLPALLEEKRLKYRIPDCYFWAYPAFDRCFAFQIQDATFSGTSIVVPDNAQAIRKLLSPKVVLIAAGLGALDHLRSNGIDLGHTVLINQWTPYKFDCGSVAGKAQECLIIRDGDICGSEELSRDLQAGRCAIQSKMVKAKDGSEFEQHFFVDKDGKTWEPQTPWIADDG